MKSNTSFLVGSALGLALSLMPLSAVAKGKVERAKIRPETLADYYKCEEGFRDANFDFRVKRLDEGWYRLADSTPPVLVNAATSGNEAGLAIYDGTSEYRLPFDQVKTEGPKKFAIKLPDGSAVLATFTAVADSNGKMRVAAKPEIKVRRYKPAEGKRENDDGDKSIVIESAVDHKVKKFNAPSSPLGEEVKQSLEGAAKDFCEASRLVAANEKTDPKKRERSVNDLLEVYNDLLVACEGVRARNAENMLLTETVATKILGCKGAADELIRPSRSSSKSTVKFDAKGNLVQ